MIISMKSKRIKKDKNLKTQSLITPTQSRVPNNTKIHQKCEKKSWEKKITFYVWGNYVKNENENGKFIVRREE